MLLYIIQKLFTRRWSAENLNFIFLKGQFTINIKPLQRSCPSPITFAGKCNSTGTSQKCVRGQWYASESTSADSNCPRTCLYRLITVRCKFKKKYFCLCKELLLSAYVPPADYYVLSADVTATDYYCPRTYLPRTITVRGRTCHGLGPSCRLSTCFLKGLLY